MAFESGIRLGPYQIISSLGAGGMGEVYRARDTRLGRHVAIKVLPPTASSDPAARERLEREARVVSALSHPHICPLFDIGEQDGHSYLVMECLEGETLAGTLRSDLQSIERCLRIAAQAADGLAHAHAAGVIHRDLKPSNVMVLPDGNIKLLDFGLARKLAAASDATVAPLTESGVVSGTVAYMSPEQTTGERIDHRTDIFSLGVVIYETLCGKRPFEGPTAFAVMQRVVSHDPPPIDTVRADVPAAVARLLERMMAKSPDDRPSSAAEIAAFFRQQSVALPSRAHSACAAATPTITMSPHSVPAVARSSRAVWIAGAVFVTGVATVGALWVRPWSSPAAATATKASTDPAAKPAGDHATASDQAKEGWQLLRRVDRAGAVEKAIEAFDAAIAADKSYASAWAGLARARWRQHNATPGASFEARALDAATQAVALEPYLADAHASLGFARVASGDVPAAKAAFDHALVLDPSNVGAHRGLGEIARGENHMVEATAHYQKAMAADPADWELPRLLGEIPYQEARYKEALKWWQLAASLAPDSGVPLRLIGAAHHMLGDYPAAAGAFQKALAVQPSAPTYTNLGTALFYQGLYPESVRAFERAVEMSPSVPLYWGNLGDAYRWVPGNTTKAKESYDRAVQLMREQLKKDPKNVTNRSRLALFLVKAGDSRAALAELLTVLTPGMTDVNTLYRGAITYELVGNRAAALQTLQFALDRGFPLAEARVEPELEKLRSDGRFQTMAARFSSVGAAK